MSKPLTIEEVRSRVERTGTFKLISDTYVNRTGMLTIEHTCGHQIQRNLRDVLRGNEACPKCSQYSGCKNTFLDMQRFVSHQTQREYKAISKEEGYKDSRVSKLKFYHKTCGQNFFMTFSNFKLGKRCPTCAAKSGESKAAQLLKRLLEQVKISFIEEKTFDEMKNALTQGALRFDLYLPELNLAIEIDGEQHSIPVSRFGGEKAFRETQWRDFQKNKFCVNNEIDLIRINLYDKEKMRRKTYTRVKREVFELLLHVVKLNKELSKVA